MAGNETEQNEAGKHSRQIVRTIRIHRPPADLYRFWRDLPNLARVFQHGLSVTAKTRDESHWSISAWGKRLEWDAVISADEPGHAIGWQAQPGAPVANSGSVRFEPASEGDTEVTLQIEYEPPGGAAGAWAADLLSKEAGRQLEAALQRFKQLLEDHGAAENGRDGIA